MLKNFANRVKETTTATDTSAIVLAGAVAAFRSFVSGLAVGTTRIECEVGPDSAGAWLIGEYTLTDATHLTRTAIVDSSSGGADVTLAAGSKEVSNTISATRLATIVASIDLAFSTTIPLTNGGEAYMPQQSVASVLAFSIGAAPVKNSRVYVRLVADGTNAPTFAGMKEWGGSMGYDNRNGIVNEAQFFYDGYDYWYSFSQAVGAVAVDATPPTANSAAVSNATPTIVNITMSEAMDSGFVPAASAFTVTGHTVSSVAISGSSINLTCSTAFVYGEAARTVSYTQPGTNNARDLAGNLLANTATPIAITNSVGAVATGITMAGPTAGSTSVASTNFTVGVTPVGGSITGTNTVTPSDGGGGGTFTPTSVALSNGTPTATFTYTPSATAGARTISVTNSGGLTNPSNITYTSSTPAVYPRLNPKDATLTETGTGPYSYAGTVSGFTSSRGTCDKALQSGVDGSLSVKIASGPLSFYMGLQTGSAVVSYSAQILYLYCVGGNYIGGGSASGSATNTVAAAVNDLPRFRRVGSTVYGEVSKDAGATWVIAYTWTGVSTGALYFGVGMDQGTTFNTLTATGLA